jgi:hypothetical protein
MALINFLTCPANSSSKSEKETRRHISLKCMMAACQNMSR